MGLYEKYFGYRKGAYTKLLKAVLKMKILICFFLAAKVNLIIFVMAVIALSSTFISACVDALAVKWGFL